jgi:hypothetical protein
MILCLCVCTVRVCIKYPYNKRCNMLLCIISLYAISGAFSVPKASQTRIKKKVRNYNKYIPQKCRIIKIVVFCVVTPCSLIETACFSETSVYTHKITHALTILIITTVEFSAFT